LIGSINVLFMTTGAVEAVWPPRVLGQRCENARDTGAGLPKLLQVEGTPCWTLFIGADLISATPKAWFDRQMDVVDATGGDAAVLSRERQPPGFEWPISCDRSGSFSTGQPAMLARKFVGLSGRSSSERPHWVGHLPAEPSDDRLWTAMQSRSWRAAFGWSKTHPPAIALLAFPCVVAGIATNAPPRTKLWIDPRNADEHKHRVPV